MHIGVLGLDFHLPGCASLKEKRRRLKRLRDKFGRVPNLAICESGHHDVHQRAQWSVVAVAGSRPVVERLLGDVERWVDERLDAIVIGVERDVLS